MLRDLRQQAWDIEDQGHGAAAENGEAAQCGHLAEHFAQGFDHGLELAEQLVNHQPGTDAGIAHHHHVFAAWRLALVIEQLAQANEGQYLTTQVEVLLPGDDRPATLAALQEMGCGLAGDLPEGLQAAAPGGRQVAPGLGAIGLVGGADGAVDIGGVTLRENAPRPAGGRIGRQLLGSEGVVRTAHAALGRGLAAFLDCHGLLS